MQMLEGLDQHLKTASSKTSLGHAKRNTAFVRQVECLCRHPARRHRGGSVRRHGIRCVCISFCRQFNLGVDGNYNMVIAADSGQSIASVIPEPASVMMLTSVQVSHGDSSRAPLG
jgi:hypothetical protein